MRNYGYTLVQHSGFGYGEKPGFEQALEIRALSGPRERQLVEKVGGVVVDTWAEADELEVRLSYPAGAGLYPQFGGTFSGKKIDGLRIAIPKREVVS